ncbi:hypothetical protein PMZ80_007741 [Knufia obscura]|uniref:Myb-like domain-containing protein n=1 Tax=Knufia obscura TaxID=1635080 RepID=A0ABR0RI64_9EURO|nr:hypothetical protein PMZ80_007741 [Knufia obscura]
MPRNARRQQRQLESVVEQEDTVVVQGSGDAGQPDVVVAANVADAEEDVGVTPRAADAIDDADEASEPADSLASSSEETPIVLDHEEIIANLGAISQNADDVLSQFKKMSIDQIGKALAEPESTISKRIFKFAQRLRDSTEPCGKAHMLPLQTLQQLLETNDLPTNGACLLFMKTNLARLMLALFNVQLEDRDLSSFDCLQHLTIVQPFPEPFVTPTLAQQAEPTGFSRECEQKTLHLGVSILTQLYIKLATDNFDENDFDPDLLLQQVFTDEDGNLRNMSLHHDLADDRSSTKRSIEKRMQDIRRYISTDADKPLNLEGLQKRYARKAFLERAVAWTMDRGEQLAMAVDNEGGVSAIRDVLEAGPQDVTPRPAKQKQSSRRSRGEQPQEDGTSFLAALDDELDAADEESEEEEEESEIDEQEEERQEQVEVEVEKPVVPERQHPETIPESPQAEGDQPEVLQEQADDADMQPEAEVEAEIEAEAADVMGDDEQVEQGLPDSAEPQPDWMTQPTQETRDVLAVIERQAKKGNKENIPPAKRRGLTDRQPDARRFDYETDTFRPASQSHSQPQEQQRDPGKRSRGDDEGSDDDAFETDTRNVKRARPTNGKAPAAREDRSESAMFINDSVEPEEPVRARSHASTQTQTQTVSKRPAISNSRVAPSSTAPSPARRAPSATISSRARSQTPSASISASAPPPSSYEQYQATKREAAANVRLASLVTSATRPRPPQVRRPWSEEEVIRLWDLMGKHGTSWSMIKNADNLMDEPKLGGRSQVQLKDKARNMKLDFLKAERPLPVELEGVTISKGHREMLRGIGIAVPGEEEEE